MIFVSSIGSLVAILTFRFMFLAIRMLPGRSDSSEADLMLKSRLVGHFVEHLSRITAAKPQASKQREKWMLISETVDFYFSFTVFPDPDCDEITTFLQFCIFQY